MSEEHPPINRLLVLFILIASHEVIDGISTISDVVFARPTDRHTAPDELLSTCGPWDLLGEVKRCLVETNFTTQGNLRG